MDRVMSVRSKLFAFISHLHSVTLTLSVETETADKKHQGRKFKNNHRKPTDLKDRG